MHRTRCHRYMLVHPATDLLVFTPRIYEPLWVSCLLCRYAQQSSRQCFSSCTEPSLLQRTTLDLIASAEELRIDYLNLKRSECPPGSAEMKMSTMAPLSPDVFNESSVYSFDHLYLNSRFGYIRPLDWTAPAGSHKTTFFLLLSMGSLGKRVFS